MATSPLQGDVHVNVPLTNISIAYMQDNSSFVADQVFPNIPVQKQSDRYFQYDRADFWRNTYQKRADSSESDGGGWKIDSTPTYFCDVWALHKDIGDQIRSNADAPLDMDRDATLWLSQQALISRETAWAAKYFATSIWKGIDGSTGDVTGVASGPSGAQVLQWQVTTSTPIVDVKSYGDDIQLRTGLRPNTLVMGRQVWTILSENAELVERVKFSGGVSNVTPAKVSMAAVATLFELDRILVSSAISATNAENITFESGLTTAFIAGKQALLVYVNPNPSLMMPSAGYTFSWTGYAGAGALGQRISKFRMEWKKCDRVEGEMAYDQKLVAAECGVFFTAIVG